MGYINKILAKKLDDFVIVYLDDILIYTKDIAQAYVDAIRLVLNELKKYSLFANFKKCCFHKDEIRFLAYVVSAQGVKIEDKQIEVVKNWLEPKSMRDIHVFVDFANFYWRFIQSFSKITGSLILMLKMSSANISSKNLLLLIDVAEVDEVCIGSSGDCKDETVGRLLSKNSNKAISYLTPNAR